jgi:hypothetical protein
MTGLRLVVDFSLHFSSSRQKNDWFECLTLLVFNLIRDNSPQKDFDLYPVSDMLRSVIMKVRCYLKTLEQK